MTTRTAARLALATTLHSAALASPAAAATVAEASAALSFWIAWGLAYLAIGVALMAIATASAVREERAWWELLRWTSTDDDAPNALGDDADDPVSQHAA